MSFWHRLVIVAAVIVASAILAKLLDLRMRRKQLAPGAETRYRVLRRSVMAGIVGFIVQAQFTDPEIAEIVVTSDGFVLARADGEVSANHFIGRYPDLLRNWLRLIAAAELTTRELIEAQAAFAAKIGFLGREIA